MDAQNLTLKTVRYHHGTTFNFHGFYSYIAAKLFVDLNFEIKGGAQFEGIFFAASTQLQKSTLHAKIHSQLIIILYSTIIIILHNG